MNCCDYCKAEGQKTGACAYCGTEYYFAGLTFIYGPTENHAYSCEIKLTDKYLIVRKVSKGEMTGNLVAGAGFGLLGAMVADAVTTAKKKHYAFYDLRELEKVIYPYCTKSLKKNTAFKFVNKDGSDFILNFNLNGMLCGKVSREFADMLPRVGISVENGMRTIYPVCCEKPFVTIDTFANRVCHSAAAFVKMTDPQFAAPAISDGGQSMPEVSTEKLIPEESTEEQLPEVVSEEIPLQEEDTEEPLIEVLPPEESPTEEKPMEKAPAENETPVQSLQKKAYSVEEWKSKW